MRGRGSNTAMTRPTPRSAPRARYLRCCSRQWCISRPNRCTSCPCQCRYRRRGSLWGIWPTPGTRRISCAVASTTTRTSGAPLPDWYSWRSPIRAPGSAQFRWPSTSRSGVRDLTEGSVDRHLVAMATPIAAGMLFQTLYFLVDLYFVGRLGRAAIAGVGSAGNLTFLVMALTQVLGVGTVALIAQAVGRKEQERANLVFNQSSILAIAALLSCLVLGYSLAPHFASALGSNEATRE